MKTRYSAGTLFFSALTLLCQCAIYLRTQQVFSVSQKIILLHCHGLYFLYSGLSVRDRSLFITWPGGRGWGGGGVLGGFLGDRMIFKRTFRESSSSESQSPKGGSLKILEGIQGTTQICLDNARLGGGITKVINSYEGDHFIVLTFKGGTG